MGPYLCEFADVGGSSNTQGDTTGFGSICLSGFHSQLSCTLKNECRSFKNLQPGRVVGFALSLLALGGVSLEETYF